MPAAVTANFRITNAKQFVDSFEEYENGGRETVEGHSYVYMFFGKILAWDKTHAGYSDNVIPSPDGDVQGNEFEPWRDMIALDRVIANTDISFAAKRSNWESGTFYTQYDDQDPSVTKGTSNFFTYTDSGNVFKCLDNNKGGASTILPKKPGAGSIHVPFVQTDGYRWKYMCTLPAATSQKFLTNNYMPIRTLNAHTEFTAPGTPDGFEDQASVQKNANNGTIETYTVKDGGFGYIAHSGAVSDANRILVPDSSSNSTFLVIHGGPGTGVSDVASHYVGASIYVSNTTHEIGVGNIKAYGTLRREAGDFVERAIRLEDTGRDGIITNGFGLERFPNNSGVADGGPESYHIGPRIEVHGDGFDANAYSICTSTGSVSQIKTWNNGNNYTTANVVTIQPLAGGGETEARAVISPPGGHGYDPVTELNGYNIIISKRIVGAGLDNEKTGTGNNFPISNEYRTIGLVRNPYLKVDYAGIGSRVEPIIHTPATSGKNWYANSSPLHQSTWVVANTQSGAASGSGDWIPAHDDEIIGNTSGATGRVIEYGADFRSIINITNVAANSTGGSFMSNEQIGKIRDASGTLSVPTETYVIANGVEYAVGARVTDGITSKVIYEPDLQPYTGDILYIENRTPITRSADQAEEIKIVIEF